MTDYQADQLRRLKDQGRIGVSHAEPAYHLIPEVWLEHEASGHVKIDRLDTQVFVEAIDA